jgi:hypothetical protein
LPKLTGHENYQRWRKASKYVLQVFGCGEIVLGTETKPKEELDISEELTNEDKIERYKDRY